MLCLTALLLFLADKTASTAKEVSFKNSLAIGIAQAIAILPGISRSGSTIASSVMLGIDKAHSAKFSFLMVIPLIFGKMAKDALNVASGNVIVDVSEVLPFSLGFAAALITGIFACKWMISLVKKSNLKYFSYYCILVGLTSIVYAISF
jgi:undecaprenyl-diphosphatase